MEKTTINSTVWTDYNKPFIAQRADPYMYKHTDGYYYFTASVPTYDKIILRRAKTIKELATAEEIVVWNKHESGEMSEHVWAPEIHFVFGKWYIYFAAGERDNVWEIRPFALECDGDPVTGEWVEKGKMQCSDDDIYSFRAFSLDGTILENKGEHYFIWAEKVSVGIGISNLYIAKMESATKLSTAQVLLTTPDYEWERVDIWVNEGPAVLKRDGKIFVSFSGSATGACYCIGLLEIDENSDVLDPKEWKKHKKAALSTDYEKQLYGPGHNSFVKSEDGKSDYMVFHARPYEEIIGDPLYDPNRNTMLLEVQWDENGRPIFEYQKSFQ